MENENVTERIPLTGMSINTVRYGVMIGKPFRTRISKKQEDLNVSICDPWLVRVSQTDCRGNILVLPPLPWSAKAS